jgi:uncharacterized protein (TIGR00297 family)
LNPEFSRALAGGLLAVAVSAVAMRRRALTTDGAVAASVTGTICAGAGWSWVIMLLAFFITGTSLSRLGADRKAERTRGLIEKGGERDAMQVLANGGAFTLFAAASLIVPSPAWMAFGAGALATSTADTWATEIGTLFGGSPRSILAWNPVPTGTSGGVSLAGSAAASGGAGFMAAVAMLVEWPPEAACAALVGGFAGCLVDSLLGASVQSKRWCDECGRGTERVVHDCGAPTRHAGGIRWMDNDIVNGISSLGGAAIGASCLM